MRALKVDRGRISELELPDGDWACSNRIHEEIGDFFTTAFMVGDVGGDYIAGFCDDLFLSKPDAVWNCALGLSLYGTVYAIANPIVIVAHTGPDARSMTPREARAFRFGGVMLSADTPALPILEYDPSAWEG